MTYIKPQVIIHQEFAQSNDSEDSTLRAMIVGPNAVLHRYSDADEKAEIALGDYIPDSDTTYRFQEIGKTVGSLIDAESPKLYADDALIAYYESEDQTGQSSESTPTIYSDPAKTNVVIAENFNFATYGQYTRNSALDRDVKIGDYAWIRSYNGAGTSSDPCQNRTFLSKIIGLSQDTEPSSFGDVTVSGPETTTGAADPTITNTTTVTTDGPELTVSGTYKVLVAGVPTPTYTIKVLSVSSTVNCASSVKVKITSNTGFSTDSLDIFKVASGTSSEAIDIGFGLSATLSNFDNLTAGDTFTFTQAFAYTRPTLTVSGTYTGATNDTYIVEVARGGEIADSDTCPLITVRTALGLDYVANVPVKDTDAQKIGGQGLSFALSAAVATGQVFTFPVTAKDYTAINGIVLQNDIPEAMRTTDPEDPIALDLKLLKKDNIVLDSTAFELNLDALEGPQFTVYGTILVTDVEFSEPKKLFKGKLFMEYREWVPSAAGEIRYADNVSDLQDLMAGQLDPDNPLKYAVYKALANSNGVSVAYTAVQNPEDESSWADAFALIEGTEDLYSVVPLTQKVSILNQAATIVETESGAEQCRWKTGVFSIPLQTTKMLVGQSDYALNKTSEDGGIVTAKFSDPNIEDDIEEYTIVTIDDNNAPLMDYGVAAGDKLRVITGEDTYNEYTIDNVFTNETCRIIGGPSANIDASVKIEIWHNMTKTEQADYYGELAASFGNRRVVVVAPDKVGEAGQVLPGYFLAAAVAGLKSGINANQGMTRVEVVGFDDYSATKPYWTESQLNRLASHGVLIVLEDANGTAYIRHALTTDMATVFTQEEAITRDYDYICKRIHSLLQEYIGRSRVTDKVIEEMYSAIQTLLLSLISSDYIRNFDNLTVQQHALLADRVEVNVTVVLPFPVNNIEVFVTAAARG